MVICHQAVGRCLLAYFMDRNQGSNCVTESLKVVKICYHVLMKDNDVSRNVVISKTFYFVLLIFL